MKKTELRSLINRLNELEKSIGATADVSVIVPGGLVSLHGMMASYEPNGILLLPAREKIPNRQWRDSLVLKGDIWVPGDNEVSVRWRKNAATWSSKFVRVIGVK